MKIKDGKWLMVIAAIIVIAIVYFGIKWWNRDIITVKTVTVNYGTIEAVVSASGIIDAPVYDLGPKMGGKILNIFVKEGDKIREGTTLAEFDDTTRLVAPASGIVAKVNYEAGETVIVGSPVIVVVNYNKSWINAQIDEIDIANIKIGDRVKITSDVYPDKLYEGEISWIAPIAELRKVGGRIKLDEESYVFPCKIKFISSHDELKVNMSVNVDIVTKKNDAALVIPREALASKNDSFHVYKAVNDRVFETKINIGIRSYGSIEAVSGISKGDLIAITNIAKLKNKGRVKIER